MHAGISCRAAWRRAGTVQGCHAFGVLRSSADRGYKRTHDTDHHGQGSRPRNNNNNKQHTRSSPEEGHLSNEVISGAHHNWGVPPEPVQVYDKSSVAIKPMYASPWFLFCST